MAEVRAHVEALQDRLGEQLLSEFADLLGRAAQRPATAS